MVEFDNYQFAMNFSFTMDYLVYFSFCTRFCEKKCRDWFAVDYQHHQENQGFLKRNPFLIPFRILEVSLPITLESGSTAY